MTQTIIGIFMDKQHAEDAVVSLKEKGFNPKDMSIVMKDSEESRALEHDTGANVAGGLVKGATTGAVVGGLAGLLAGTVLPGLGGFLIGGPIGLALGLTGAAATTISGAATGVVAGGIIGAIMGLGVPDEDAKLYEKRINEGGILVAVPASDANVAIVEESYAANNAQDVMTVTMPAAIAKKRQGKKEKYTPLQNSHAFKSQSSYAQYGAKGGQKDTRMGWHGESTRHSTVKKESSKDIVSK